MTVPHLAPAAPARPWRKRAGRIGAGVLLVVVAAILVATHRDLLLAAPATLARSCPTWVLVAVALECTSLIAYALLQRRLLRAGGAAVRLRSVLGTVVGADAIATLVPIGGSGLAMAFAYRDFRRDGVDAPVAPMTPVLSAAISGSAFVGLVAVAAVVAQGADVAGFALAVLVVVAVLAAVLLRGRRTAGPAALLSRASRLVGSVRVTIAARVAAVLDGWARRRIGTAAIGYAALCGGARWSADAMCLAAAIAATGVGVPWDRLLLVWAAGAAVTTLGLTPGGLGTADAVLVTALVGTGMAPAAAGAATVLYRLIALKPVPRIAWFAYRRRLARAAS